MRRSPSVLRVLGDRAEEAPSVPGVVKLSVIVPYFNVRPFITEALRSLRANVRENYEIVFVDDCSTDGTPEVVAALVPELRCEVRQIRHEKNSSIGTARNTGLRAASGEYLTFL